MYFANYTMLDDGLRHIIFAMNKDEMYSWGNVYPKSLFSNSYDPWFMWHNLLKVIGDVVGIIHIHQVINILVFFSLSILFDVYIRRFITIEFDAL